MKKIEVKCKVDASEIEEAIKKMARLNEILEEANLLISKLTSKELTSKVKFEI